MTKEEMMEMRVGDIAYVPFYVDAVDKERNRVIGVRLAEKVAMDSGDKGLVGLFHISPEYIEYFKRPRRKFKPNDLVEWKGNMYLVEDDENSFGVVVLAKLHKPRLVDQNELKLVLPAEEVEKLDEWKGGENDDC